MLTVGLALKALQSVGPVIAALPEFKKLFDAAVSTFDKNADQETLRRAYDLAVDGAADAHADLQKLVAENS